MGVGGGVGVRFLEVFILGAAGSRIPSFGDALCAMSAALLTLVDAAR